MNQTAVPLRIDFVSDVSCPWCAVGLGALEQALAHVGDALDVELHFQPFELNPHMPPQGEDVVEHLSRKYGIDAAQIETNREAIRQRGESVGFRFGRRDRIWNTFDAHRLLHWAGVDGGQLALKTALLEAYHTDGENVGDHDVLLRIVDDLGLDAARARAVLDSDEFGTQVRARERWNQAQGIQGVPAVIVDDRYLVSGGQPPEVYEQTLRQILQQARESAT